MWGHLRKKERAARQRRHEQLHAVNRSVKAVSRLVDAFETSGGEGGSSGSSGGGDGDHGGGGDDGAGEADAGDDDGCFCPRVTCPLATTDRSLCSLADVCVAAAGLRAG